MNKTLLIWNIVITVALAVAVFSGCTTLDPQLASAVQETKDNRAILEQVVSIVNQHQEDITSMRADIAKNTVTIAATQGATQAAIAASQVAMQQWVQQYVQAYVAQVVP